MFNELDVTGNHATPQPQPTQSLSADGQSTNHLNENGEIIADAADLEQGNRNSLDYSLGNEVRLFLRILFHL